MADIPGGVYGCVVNAIGVSMTDILILAIPVGASHQRSMAAPGSSFVGRYEAESL